MLFSKASSVGKFSWSWITEAIASNDDRGNVANLHSLELSAMPPALPLGDDCLNPDSRLEARDANPTVTASTYISSGLEKPPSTKLEILRGLSPLKARNLTTNIMGSNTAVRRVSRRSSISVRLKIGTAWVWKVSSGVSFHPGSRWE